MGFLDFLKKKVELESNNIEELKKEIKIHEKKAIKKIKDNILLFIQKSKNPLNVLKNIDLSDKKEEERVKIIIKNSISDFLSEFNNLIEQLQKIDINQDLLNLNKKIDEIINNFEKKTNKHYQKITYIVGEELKNTTKTIDFLIKNHRKILFEYDNILKINSEFKKLYELEKESESISKNLKEISKEISENNSNILELEKEFKNLQKEKKDFELSPEYKKLQQDLKFKEDLKKELEDKIIILRNDIDFKNLLNENHHNSKNLELLKEYKSSFKTNILKFDSYFLRFLSDDQIRKYNSIKNISEKLDIPISENKIDKIDYNLNQIRNKLSQLKNLRDKLIQKEIQTKKDKDKIINSIKTKKETIVQDHI